MNTCLDWRSKEIVELAKQVGVEATPAFADKVGTLMDKSVSNKNNSLAPKNKGIPTEINDWLVQEIDKLNENSFSKDLYKKILSALDNYIAENNIPVRIKEADKNNKAGGKSMVSSSRYTNGYVIQLDKHSKNIAKELLHELVHITTNHFFSVEVPNYSELNEQLEVYYAAFSKKFNSRDDFKFIRNTVDDFLNKKISREELDKKLTPEQLDLYHAYENSAEFISSFISSSTLQAFVTDINQGDRTLFQELTEYIKDFIQKLFKGYSFLDKNEVLEDILNFIIETKDTYKSPNKILQEMYGNTFGLITNEFKSEEEATLAVKDGAVYDGDVINIAGEDYTIYNKEGEDIKFIKAQDTITTQQPSLPTPEQVKEYLANNKPVQPTAPTIKEGVQELFDSNPEVANEVYKAYGIKDDVEVPVIDTEDITTSEGTKLAASYNYKKKEIKVNRKFLKQKFEEKAWTKPRTLIELLHGEKVESFAEALPENQFTTYEEFERFVIQHERQHSIYTEAQFKKEFPDGTKGQYETAINNLALEHISNVEAQKKVALQAYSDYLGNLKKEGTGSIKDFSKFADKYKKELVRPKQGMSLDYAEVLLPAWTADFFGEEFRDVNGNIDFKLVQQALEDEGFEGIGYRIPTEDKYSMLPIKIIGFLPENAGGAIMLPAEITTIAGSDYDVDKMFVILKNFKKYTNKEGKTKFEVIKYLDESNSDLDKRYKVFAYNDPRYREIYQSYRESLDKADATIERSKKLQDNKISELKAKKELDEKEINELWEEAEIRRLERDYVNSLIEILERDINVSKAAGVSAEDLTKHYNTLTEYRETVATYTEEIKKLDTLRKEKSAGKVKKEEVSERYEKKKLALDKYYKAKEAIYDKIWEDYNEVNPKDEFAKLPMAEQNIRKARDNRKVDIYIAMLTNENTTAKMLQPGGFDYLKSIMNEITGLKGKQDKATDIFSLNDVDRMTVQNLAGKALVGVAANHNKHHTLRQWSNLELTDPIKFDKTEYKSLHGQTATTTAGETRLISRNFAEILATVVDNAKDPVTSNLNYNGHTADMISLLIGAGVDIKTVFAFINQPVIVRAVTLVNNRQARNLKDAFGMVAKEMGIELPSGKDLHPTMNNQGALLESLSGTIKSVNQPNVLQSALYYLNISSDLATIIRASKADTAGIGKSIEEGLHQERVIKEALKIESISGVKDFLEDGSRFTQMFTKYGVTKPESVLKNMYPYGKEEFVLIKSAVADMAAGKLTAEDFQDINREYLQYKMSDFGYYGNSNYTNVVKYTPTFLYQLKQFFPEFQFENRLLYSLKVNFDHKNIGIPVIEFSNDVTASEVQIERVKQDWQDLFNPSVVQEMIDFVNANYSKTEVAKFYDNMGNPSKLLAVWNDKDSELFAIPENRQLLKRFAGHMLADNLIKYSFFTTGHEFTPISIGHLLPEEYLSLRDGDTTLSEYAYNILDNSGEITEEFGMIAQEFTNKFLRHHYKEAKYVPRVAKDGGNINGFATDSDGRRMVILGDDPKLLQDSSLLSYNQKQDIYEPKYFYLTEVKGGKYHLYEYAMNTTNEVGGYNYYYKEISPLGISGLRTEYRKGSIEDSIYPVNQVETTGTKPTGEEEVSGQEPTGPKVDDRGMVSTKDAVNKNKECEG